MAAHRALKAQATTAVASISTLARSSISAATCTAGVATESAACAQGACPTPVTQSCGAYLCGSSGCATSCSFATGCAAPFVCNTYRMCVPEDDIDGDGVPNAVDNCAYAPNPDQADSDNDGIFDEDVEENVVESHIGIGRDLTAF